MMSESDRGVVRKGFDRPYFKSTAKGIEQDSKEKDRSALEETGRVVGHIVENTCNNQRHDEVSNQLSQS